jgi:tetratricopeptide (TPR) repeat protein
MYDVYDNIEQKCQMEVEEKMRHIQTIVILFLVALLAVSALSGCGGETMSAEEHFEKGNEYAQTGEFEKAIEEYKSVLKMEPEHISAFTNLGVAYYSVGRLEDAIDQYEKAIEIAPEDADIHSNLAAAYVQLGALEKALQEYQTAVDLKPDLAEAYFGLGVIYDQLGQNDPIASDQAAEHLKKLQGQ